IIDETVPNRWRLGYAPVLEYPVGPGQVAAQDGGDRQVWQYHVGVERRNGCCVPVGDLSRKDPARHYSIQVERRLSGQVVHEPKALGNDRDVLKGKGGRGIGGSNSLIGDVGDRVRVQPTAEVSAAVA